MCNHHDYDRDHFDHHPLDRPTSCHLHHHSPQHPPSLTPSSVISSPPSSTNTVFGHHPNSTSAARHNNKYRRDDDGKIGKSTESAHISNAPSSRASTSQRPHPSPLHLCSVSPTLPIHPLPRSGPAAKSSPTGPIESACATLVAKSSQRLDALPPP